MSVLAHLRADVGIGVSELLLKRVWPTRAGKRERVCDTEVKSQPGGASFQVGRVLLVLPNERTQVPGLGCRLRIPRDTIPAILPRLRGPLW